MNDHNDDIPKVAIFDNNNNKAVCLYSLYSNSNSNVILVQYYVTLFYSKGDNDSPKLTSKG